MFTIKKVVLGSCAYPCFGRAIFTRFGKDYIQIQADKKAFIYQQIKIDKENEYVIKLTKPIKYNKSKPMYVIALSEDKIVVGDKSDLYAELNDIIKNYNIFLQLKYYDLMQNSEETNRCVQEILDGDYSEGAKNYAKRYWRQ